jgi:hypothetical protein
VPRTRGQVRLAADRECGRHRPSDEGGHLGARRRPITPAEAAKIAAVGDTFVRAIETSDFERRLRLVEADHFCQPGEATGVYRAGPNGYYYNP